MKEQTAWRAGFSQTVITPGPGMLMAGHPGEKRAAKVIDDLYARTLVLRNDRVTVVLVSVDVLFVSTATVARIRETLGKHGIPASRVFVNATHTHSGPLTTDLFGEAPETGYVLELEDSICRGVAEAWTGLRDVRIGFSSGSVEGITFNSRYLMKDGRIETHPWKGIPDIVGPEGPVDTELLALYVTDAHGNLLAGLANFANHPQVLERENAGISADFPGRIEKFIREQTGGTPVILFGNGACGNICPVDARNTDNTEIGEPWMDRIGKRMAEEYLKGYCSAEWLDNCPIGIRNTRVEIPLREIPESLFQEARHFRNEYRNRKFEPARVSNYGCEGKGKGVLSLEEFLATPYWKNQAHKEILALAEESARQPLEEIELSMVSIGNNALVMVPVELFVEFGLEIKEKSPFCRTFVIELANGYSGYVPTRKAFSRSGGYETRLLRSSKLVPEAGELMVKKIIEILDELKKGESS